MKKRNLKKTILITASVATGALLIPVVAVMANACSSTDSSKTSSSSPSTTQSPDKNNTPNAANPKPSNPQGTDHTPSKPSIGNPPAGSSNPQGGQSNPQQGGQSNPDQNKPSQNGQGGQSNPQQGGQSNPDQNKPSQNGQGGQSNPQQGGQSNPNQNKPSQNGQGGQNNPQQGGQSNPNQNKPSQNGQGGQSNPQHGTTGGTSGSGSQSNPQHGTTGGTTDSGSSNGQSGQGTTGGTTGSGSSNGQSGQGTTGGTNGQSGQGTTGGTNGQGTTGGQGNPQGSNPGSSSNPNPSHSSPNTSNPTPTPSTSNPGSTPKPTPSTSNPDSSGNPDSSNPNSTPNSQSPLKLEPTLTELKSIGWSSSSVQNFSIANSFQLQEYFLNTQTQVTSSQTITVNGYNNLIPYIKASKNISYVDGKTYYYPDSQWTKMISATLENFQKLVAQNLKIYVPQGFNINTLNPSNFLSFLQQNSFNKNVYEWFSTAGAFNPDTNWYNSLLNQFFAPTFSSVQVVNGNLQVYFSTQFVKYNLPITIQVANIPEVSPVPSKTQLLNINWAPASVANFEIANQFVLKQYFVNNFTNQEYSTTTTVNGYNNLIPILNQGYITSNKQYYPDSDWNTLITNTISNIQKYLASKLSVEIPYNTSISSLNANNFLSFLENSSSTTNQNLYKLLMNVGYWPSSTNWNNPVLNNFFAFHIDSFNVANNTIQLMFSDQFVRSTVPLTIQINQQPQYQPVPSKTTLENIEYTQSSTNANFQIANKFILNQTSINNANNQETTSTVTIDGYNNLIPYFKEGLITTNKSYFTEDAWNSLISENLSRFQKYLSDDLLVNIPYNSSVNDLNANNFLSFLQNSNNQDNQNLYKFFSTFGYWPATTNWGNPVLNNFFAFHIDSFNVINNTIQIMFSDQFIKSNVPLVIKVNQLSQYEPIPSQTTLQSIQWSPSSTPNFDIANQFTVQQYFTDTQNNTQTSQTTTINGYQNFLPILEHSKIATQFWTLDQWNTLISKTILKFENLAKINLSMVVPSGFNPSSLNAQNFLSYLQNSQNAVNQQLYKNLVNTSFYAYFDTGNNLLNSFEQLNVVSLTASSNSVQVVLSVGFVKYNLPITINLVSAN